MCYRPQAFCGMQAVVRRVSDIVQEVARARRRAVGGKGGERLAPAAEIAELRGEDDPREEQQVLRPLSRSQRDQHGRKIRSCSSIATPGPVSSTATDTRPFAAVNSSCTRPPSGVQRNAFESRLEMICRTRSPSETIVGCASKSFAYSIRRRRAS